MLLFGGWEEGAGFQLLQFQEFQDRGPINLELNLSLNLKGYNPTIFTTEEASKCNLDMGVGSVAGELQRNDSRYICK